MMPGLSDLIADDLTGHTVDLIRVSEGTLRETILGNFKSLEEDLIDKIGAIGIDASPSQIVRLRRLEKLKAKVTESIKSTYKKNRNALTDDITDLSALEARATKTAFNNRIGVELMNVTPTPQVIRAIAKGAVVQGAPVKDWWARQATKTRNSFEDQMTQGILAGESTSALIQRVRGTATGKKISYEFNGKKRSFNEFEGGIIPTSTREATALVRTSVQSVANTARLETYKANSDVIGAVQALASLDSRTTPICQARSGSVWDLETGNPREGTQEPFPGPPPWHWNCRSTLIPVTKSWDELSGKSGIPEIPPSTQSSMDGQVAGNLTYESWLKKKSSSFQKEVLGASKFKIWKKGELTLRDFIDAQTSKPLTVSQLKLKLEPGSTHTIPKGPPKLKRLKKKSQTPADVSAEYQAGKTKIWDIAPKRGLPPAAGIEFESVVGVAKQPIGKRLAKLDADPDLLALEKELQGLITMDHASGRGVGVGRAMMDSWNASSTSTVSSVMQMAIKQELGLSLASTTHLEISGPWKAATKVMNNKAAASGARKVVREMYEDTQAMLKAEGLEEIIAFRGLKFQRTPSAIAQHIDELGGIKIVPTGTLNVVNQPLTAFSLDARSAARFADAAKDKINAIVSARIPRRRIFSTPVNGPGTFGENEILVLGAEDDVKIMYFKGKQTALRNDENALVSKLAGAD